MEESPYQKLMRQVRQCQQRSKKTISSIDNTLIGVRQTIKDIQQTHNNIDKIKAEYSSVMDRLCQKIAKSFTITDEPFKKIEGISYEHLPIEISYEQLVQRILQHDNILIVTGAGVSADSGIPTFRGKNGLYSNGFISKGRSYTPQEFITYQMFKQSPEEIWNWINSIYLLSIDSKPNQIHHQIDILAKLLSKLNKKVTIATQNIDDLHLKPINNEYLYFNIHGNCKQVRCNQHHFHQYNPRNRLQKCNICGGDIRPHVLFFDEAYGKDYGQEIKDQKFPFVICIGSSVKTGLAINMIKQAEQVVEINPEPVIQIGRVYRFTEKTDTLLKQLNSILKNKKKF